MFSDVRRVLKFATIRSKSPISKLWIFFSILFENFYFLQKQLYCLIIWPTARKKNVLVIEKNFWNSRLKAKNLQNNWDQSNNLFEQIKGRTVFKTESFFYFVPGGFSDPILWNNYNSYWKKVCTGIDKPRGIVRKRLILYIRTGIFTTQKTNLVKVAQLDRGEAFSLPSSFSKLPVMAAI